MNTVWNFRGRPGYNRLRDGSLAKSNRSAEQWKRALAGHIRSAHGGEKRADCAACRELERKAN